jgi:hypothetical protein
MRNPRIEKAYPTNGWIGIRDGVTGGFNFGNFWQGWQFSQLMAVKETVDNTRDADAQLISEI